MKKIILHAIVGLLVMSACEQNNEVPAESNYDFNTEEAVESAFAEIDVLTEAGMEDLQVEGARIVERRDEKLACATIEKDTVNQVITIDFGDGCEGPEGHVKSGQIVIQYSGRRFEAGSFRIVTFNDFVIDSIGIEGTRTLTNISGSVEDHPSFTITLEGGKMTFPDGTFATREASHTRVWYRENNPREDYWTLDGSASGLNREGIAYASEILETLTFKRSCGRVQIPVSGSKLVTLGEQEVMIDFGDGTCDNLITKTIDGVTTEHEVDVRKHRKRHRRG